MAKPSHPELVCDYTFTWDGAVQDSHLVWEDREWVLLTSMHGGFPQWVSKRDLEEYMDGLQGGGDV